MNEHISFEEMEQFLSAAAVTPQFLAQCAKIQKHLAACPQCARQFPACPWRLWPKKRPPSRKSRPADRLRPMVSF